MLDTLKYYFKIILLWTAVFFIAKVYFLWVNFSSTEDWLSLPSIWTHGFRLDLSVIGYIAALPLLLSALSRIYPRLVAGLLKGYWVIVWLIVGLIITVDPYFFSYWGQKTNLGFTQFLGKENAGISSIESSTFVVVILFFILTTWWFLARGLRYLAVPKKINFLVILLLLGVNVLLIRGGWGKVPINVSSAYFSNNNLHNNASLNSIWNLLAAELEKDKHAALVFFDSNEEAKAILKAEDKSEQTNLADRLLIPANDSTNVLLIVLESFTAKAVGQLSGPTYGSTPNLDQVIQKGVSYDQAYASSFRSDKGLLALTTGFSSGARQTLTNFPDKLTKHWNIFRALSPDYHTSFYYGGNLEFANIKVLFSGADEVIAQRDFNTTNKNTWGVHDDEVFRRFSSDFLTEDEPQFKMLFSLSSHEPFDVPNFKTKKDPYLNSIAYTDSCLGVMISQIKASSKWGNTLIIITADHGTIRPDNAPLYDTANFRIPLVLTGGRVKQDTTISNVVSQAHVASTIAEYLGKEQMSHGYTLLQPRNAAFYSYHDGLVSVTDSCVQHYDLAQKKYLFPACNTSLEQAFYQLDNFRFFNP